ncbi:MAG: helix-turn-helix domain-containing protein [Mariprofundaceae bacterium]
MAESPHNEMINEKKGPSKNYYELLQINRNAGPMDIIHAYRHAKLAYQQDSLAVYSLYSDEEIETIRSQIETAYHVLSDPEKRKAYDASLGDEAGPEQPQTSKNQKVIRFSDYSEQDSLQSDLNKVSDQDFEQNFEQPFEQQYDDIDEYTGALLKEIREKKGITIDSIADHTKIGKQYLYAIETEREDDFPEKVYLKGYLGQYAAEIGLDPQKVVQTYPPLIDIPET